MITVSQTSTKTTERTISVKLNLKRFVAVAAFVASPAFAAPFTVDFENTWSKTGNDGDVNGYYGGGTAGDGVSSGPNVGVTFVGVTGLSNGDGLGHVPPGGDYYANAPSPLGVAIFLTGDIAYMNVAAGVDSFLKFYYSSPAPVTGALTAYDGLNGGGSVLGTFDLADTGGHFITDPDGTFYEYDAWTLAQFNFTGTARSFAFSAAAGIAALDNISNVPEPGTIALTLASLGLLGFARQRKQ
jgi:hypothetical protein